MRGMLGRAAPLLALLVQRCVVRSRSKREAVRNQSMRGWFSITAGHSFGRGLVTPPWRTALSAQMRIKIKICYTNRWQEKTLCPFKRVERMTSAISLRFWMP